MQNKELFFMICPKAAEVRMSNRHNFSSFHRFSRDSSQDTSNSTTGAQSEQSSSRSSSFSGGWRRHNSDSRHQASGGGGWERPQYASAAASGGWGRSSFQRPQDAVGGGWGSRLPSTEDSSQKPQQPQQPELEQEQSCQDSAAPAEEYSFDSVRHAFKEKYVISFQDDLPVIEQNVQNYITANPLKYGQPIKLAIERALFKIHEELQTKLGKTIPEKDSCPRAQTMQEEFILKLRTTLSSYGHTSPDHVSQFVTDYIKKPFSELFLLDTIDNDTGRPMCLRPSQAYTDQHMTHAINTYFMSLDLPSILRDRFGFVDGKMPTQLFRQLLPHIRNLIKHAKIDDGQIVNGFLIICPPKSFKVQLREKLLKSLITSSRQSNSVHFVSLTSVGSPNTGDICLVIPDKIYTQTKSEKENFHARTMARKPGMSQYKTKGQSGCILLGMNEVLDWMLHGIQCSFNGANMQLPMEQFCTILRNNSRAISLFVEDEQITTFSKEQPEHDQCSIHDDISSAEGGWGAAAP
jgi:hypothetical protein